MATGDLDFLDTTAQTPISSNAYASAEDDPLFSGNNPDEPNLFPWRTTVSSRGDDSAKRVALMSSLAQIKYGITEPKDADAAAVDNLARIQSGDEQGIREQVSRAQQSAAIGVLADEVNNTTDADQATIVQNALNYFQASLTPEATDPHVVETGAVDQVVDMSFLDPTAAELHRQNIRDLDEHTDYMKKVAILQSKLTEFEDINDRSSWAVRVQNYLATWLPINQLYQTLGITDVPGNNRFNLGKRFRNQRDALFDLPLDAFKQQVDKFFGYKGTEADALIHNPQIDADTVKNLLDFTDEDITGMNVHGAIDATTFLPFTRLGKAGAKVLDSMRNPINFIKTLNRKMAVDVTLDTVERAAAGAAEAPANVVNTLQGIDAMMPSNQQVVKDLAVGVSGDVARKIEERNILLAEQLRLSQTNIRLTPEEQKAAIDSLQAQLEARFKKGQIADIKTVDHDPVTGMQTVDVYLGKADGTGGFSKMESAVTSAKNRGLYDYEIAQDNSGQWFIRQRHNVTETGFILPKSLADTKAYGFTADYTNPLSWLNERTRRAQILATHQRQRLSAALNKNVRPAFAALKSSELADLNTILAKGHDEEKWFSLPELEERYHSQFNRMPTDKEINAYYANVQLNQFDWAVRNNSVYTSYAREGYEQGIIDKLGVNAPVKRITRFDSAEMARIHDVTTGITYSPKTAGGNLTQAQLEKLVSEQGYEMVLLDTPVWIGEGKANPINLVIGKKGDIKVGRLHEVQLGYREGGHRLYTPNLKYVKQARIGKFSDGGTYNLDPITHIGSESLEGATKWANKMEDLRQGVLAFRAGKLTEQELADRFLATNVRDLDQWDRMVADGAVVEDQPFRVVHDGELPPEMIANADNHYNMTSQISNPMLDNNRWFSQGNKKYTGFRGERLLGPDDTELAILDPLSATQQAVANAVQTGAFNDFRAIAIEEWAAKARPFLKLDGKETMNGMFFNPVFKDGIDAEAVAKLVSERENVLRQLKTRSRTEITNNAAVRKFANWVENKSQGYIPQSFTVNALSSDYASRLRGIAFDAYLGLYNPRQILIQAQTALAAVATDPAKGLKAMRGLWSMRTALNADEKLLGEIAKRQALMHGMETGEFKTMMQELQRSGFAEVGDDRLLIGSQTDAIATTPGVGSLARGFQDVRVGGRVFLNEAERVNRLTAWNMAWHQAKDRGINLTSTEGRAWIQDKASALSFDMTQAARSKLQEGVLAIPTQFYQYSMHSLQNTFSTMSRFSKPEQMRLMIGQVIMYGSAAIPGGRWAVEALGQKYKEATGENLNPTAYRQITSGMWDALAYGISDGELDTNFGSRAGAGVFVDQIKDLWTDHSFLGVLGGPSMSFFLGQESTPGLVGAIANNAQYIWDAVYDNTLTPDDLLNAGMDVARELAVVNSVERAHIIWSKGVLMTKNGNLLGGASKLDSLAVILGVPLRAEADASFMAGLVKDNKETNVETAKMIVEINNRAIFSKSQSERKAYARQVNFLLQHSNPQARQQILFEVQKRLGPDFYLSMASSLLQQEPNSQIAIQPAIKKQNELKDKNNNEPMQGAQ